MIEELQTRIAGLEAIIAAQATIIEQLKAKIVELETRLNKNSSNSSKPPSTDPPWKKQKLKKGGKNKKGAQPGHVGANRELLPPEEVDEVVACMPTEACPCGGKIELGVAFETKQVFEIPRFDPTCTEYRIFSGCCASCHAKFKGSLPVGTPTGILGPNALALIGVLTGQYHLSKRDVEQIMSDCFGLPISLGTVCNAEQIVAEALEQPFVEASEAIRQESVLGADETSHRVSGKCAWMWIALCSQLAVFFARSSRSKAVAEEILGKEFSGILVSDRYGAYKWVGRRQFCWAHLIRDFRKYQETPGPSQLLADEVLRNVKKMFILWHRHRDGLINRAGLQQQMLPFCLMIEALLKKGQDLSAIGSFCKALHRDKEFLWTFIRQENVEPTNNHAERTLRQCVIWRKTSFGTQGENGNRFVERILTAVSSCKLQGRKPVNYLREAIAAHFHGQPAPSLLPLAA